MAAAVLYLAATLSAGAQQGGPAADGVPPQSPDTPPASPADTANERGTFTLQVENDLFNAFGPTDRDYTSGVRLGWMSPATTLPHWLVEITTVPTIFGESGATSAIRRWGLSVGQNIYTPDNITASQRLYGDRPYAGWIYASGALQYTYLHNSEPVRQDTLQLDIGLVGPSAGGEWAQNNVHNILHVQRANGWANQLHDEVTFGLSFERRWRVFRTTLAEDPAVLEFDIVPRAALALGTVTTYASAGGAVRLGKDLHIDFGAARARPALPGSDAFTGNDFAWYVFLGGDVQAVARNMFIDGNLDGTGSTVTRRPLVFEAQAGLALVLKGARITFSHVLRTPEYFERNRTEQFGSVNVTFRY